MYLIKNSDLIYQKLKFILVQKDRSFFKCRFQLKQDPFANSTWTFPFQLHFILFLNR